MELLYTDHYWYRSGTTQTMRNSLAEIVDVARHRADLNTGDMVLDIGSNDGTLLRNYPKDVITVGVEPAKNLAEEGRRGINFFIPEFWGGNARATLQKIIDDVGKKPKIITALGMLYDLENPNCFMNDVSQVLYKDGLFVCQLMCLRNMIQANDVGNLAHEHLEFYTLRSLNNLFLNNGLRISSVIENTINGSSFRILARPSNSDYWDDNDTPISLSLQLEMEGLIDARMECKQFKAVTDRTRDLVREFILKAVAENKQVWVYGSSTKGNTIMQYYGLDDEIVGAADKSQEKWGRYMVGTGIEIFSEDTMRKSMPDYCLVLPYAFLPEFMEREKNETWRVNGGKFIVPLPHFRVV